MGNSGPNRAQCNYRTVGRKLTKDRLAQEAGGLRKGNTEGKLGFKSNWTENLKITEDVIKATSTRGKERQLEPPLNTKRCFKKET